MRIVSKLLNVLFPERLTCLSCGREAAVGESGLCRDCEMGIETFNSAPMMKDIEGYTAAYLYNEVSGRMVKRLKYNNAKYLAKPLGESISIPPDWKIDAVVPVPLHYKRLRKRGFNQSELIAKYLCEKNGLRLEPSMLVRSRNTSQQTRLSEAGRKRNVKNAFLGDDSCKGLNVLLIDDVRTTGATLSECAAELKKHGCAKVYAATACWARFQKGGSV